MNMNQWTYWYATTHSPGGRRGVEQTKKLTMIQPIQWALRTKDCVMFRDIFNLIRFAAILYSCRMNWRLWFHILFAHTHKKCFAPLEMVNMRMKSLVEFINWISLFLHCLASLRVEDDGSNGTDANLPTLFCNCIPSANRMNCQFYDYLAMKFELNGNLMRIFE